MANSYFQFKQFRIDQEHCALKVGTDNGLFGAYLASVFRDQGKADTLWLDIGTGTGLLSLMLAQKTQARIDAIELDPEAASQAEANFKHSPWSGRLRGLGGNVLDLQGEGIYSGMLSNPPFYEHGLLPRGSREQIARHSGRLRMLELLEVCGKLGTPDAWLAILLPFRAFDRFGEMALSRGWFLRRNLEIAQAPGCNPYRQAGIFYRTPGPLHRESLAIRDFQNQYSEQFRDLLRDYYLFL